MKIIILCCTIFIIFGCNKEITAPKYTEPKVTFTIDSVLNQSQSNSLPKDNNNYYHLKLDSTTSIFNKIVGTFLVNDKPNQIPSPVVGRIEWTSSYKFLTTSNNTTEIWKSYFNEYSGKWMTVKIGNYVPNGVYVYDGINQTSDVSFGTIGAIFKSVPQMKGDTLTFVGNAVFTIETKKDELFSTYRIDSIQKVVKVICE